MIPSKSLEGCPALHFFVPPEPEPTAARAIATSEAIREVLLRPPEISALLASELCSDHLINDTLASEERPF